MFLLKIKHLMIYIIIFRTMSNIDIDCNDHLNYSEVSENQCFNQTAQSELEEMSGSNSDVISLENDSSSTTRKGNT